jgi:predicted peptidase
MKKRYYNSIFLLIIAILPATTGVTSERSSEFLKKEFKGQNGGILPYRILYPQNYNPDKQYPLLLFLHGSGERGSDNEKQLIHGSSMFLEPENRNKFPAFVVFPQCPEDEWWIHFSQRQALDENPDLQESARFPASEPMKLVLELIDVLISELNVDNNRLYVMGLSMGGYGTFDLISRRPEKFAAAVPICGGGNPGLAEKYAPHTSLWVFHGEEDTVVPAELSRTMVKAIEEAGGNVKYTEYKGVGHNSWDPAFEEEDLLPWIFDQETRK